MNIFKILLKMIVPKFIRQLKQKKFNNLPYEIKLIIFEKLNTITLCRIRCVSKEFKQLADDVLKKRQVQVYLFQGSKHRYYQIKKQEEDTNTQFFKNNNAHIHWSNMLKFQKIFKNTKRVKNNFYLHFFRRQYYPVNKLHKLQIVRCVHKIQGHHFICEYIKKTPLSVCKNEQCKSKALTIENYNEECKWCREYPKTKLAFSLNRYKCVSCLKTFVKN